MGNYNPRAPYILGQEWVPIRDEVVQFPVQDNPFEIGHTFTLQTATALADARFHLPDPSPPYASNAQVISIYPTGSEALSGPIKRVVIPVNAGQVTGNTFSSGISSDIVRNLSNPSDTSFFSFSQPSTPVTASLQSVTLYFATNAYAQQLNGKRIMAVNLLYSGYMYNTQTRGALEPGPNFSTFTQVYIANDSQFAFTQFGDLNGLPNIGQNGIYQQVLSRIRFGDTTQLFQSPNTQETIPWRYAELQKFEATNVNRTGITIQYNAQNAFDNIILNYVALEIIYCEEQRVVWGGMRYVPYGLGTNVVPLRSASTGALSPILPAGNYTVMLSNGDSGDRGNGALLKVPPLNALRELYAIPSHTGYETDLTQTIGDEFTRTVSHVLPQLSISATGGTVLTDPHVYGRQVAAPVYGTIVAQQSIYDDVLSGATNFTQIRYYARRFGNTTQPLVFSGVSPAGLVGISASLTVSAFDALPEIMDGWKEVILRLSASASMGGLSPDPVWQWTSTGELVGNQWQVLGAAAPAISGVPGNLLTQSPQQAGAATYQPTAGSAIALTWLQPNVTAVALDATADAALVFSQEPPVISGVAISTLSQSITGFTECGSGPCCIPSAISYNRITWTASTLPATGFGAYELSRYDPTEASWKVIALATTRTVTGFNDYEARVGVTSSYMLRQQNVLGFYGLYSVTGTGTITEPGVTLPSCGTNKRGVLIFTSNESQTGAYNLAYAMTYDDEVVEDFSFPESSGFQVTPHYDRDYQVAFHGTERGGEAFSRRLLTANAAVALPRLANFKSLRDMAWADLPYVCVRDDIGDRWLAAVVVPGGEVRRNRRLYNATITIIETTNTPSPVNPA